jgi:hypothetical protein
MASGSKPTKTTTARARRLNKKSTKKSESSGEFFDAASDSDGADDSDTTNNNTVEQAPTANLKGKAKTAIQVAPGPAPSQQSVSLTSRKAFDVRHFFKLPDKTCHRCL